MFLCKVMALPFLPAEHIRNAFDALYAQAADIGGPILKDMYNIYIHIQALRVLLCLPSVFKDKQYIPPI